MTFYHLQWTLCHQAWHHLLPTVVRWCPPTVGCHAWLSRHACLAWSVVRSAVWTCLTPSHCPPPPRLHYPAFLRPTPWPQPQSPLCLSRSTATAICTTGRKSVVAVHLGLNTSSSPSLVAPLPMRTAWVSTAGVCGGVSNNCG